VQKNIPIQVPFTLRSSALTIAWYFLTAGPDPLAQEECLQVASPQRVDAERQRDDEQYDQ